MKELLFSFLCLVSLTYIAKAQQQEMYTFCTGTSYGYLLDTNATSTTTYFQRFSLGATAYTAHFFKDTIYQTYGSGSGGGAYGSIKKWAWNGTSVTNVWTYSLSNAHHDICPLPNGNVLVIMDESKTAANMTAAGGSTAMAVNSPTIVEIKPAGATTGTIVWQWKLWDHLCQSTNSSVTSTYVSDIKMHPELFNINCTSNGGVTSDWFHVNGIDYNPVLDQIVFSSHIKNEVYIIDHSTTTAQAATHSGGHAGHGGDFLLRWGSPENYGCTTGGNGISIHVIHDARWVPATNSVWPNYISVFNNNTGYGNARALLFLPTYSATVPYTYDYTPGSVVGPTTCIIPIVKSFTVQNQGGCQALDNGNILITNPNTAFYECRNSTSALQSITVGTVQAERLRKVDVFGPWITTTIGASTICTNTSTTLNCNISSAPAVTNPTYTYSWTSVPAGFTSNLQNPTITPTSAGTITYTVVVSMTGTCSATAVSTSTSASITVTVNDPGTVSISESNGTLTSSSATGNQWYEETTGLLAGQTNASFTPTTNGNYYVIVTNNSGCTVTSPSYSFTLQSEIISDDKDIFSIYPNPSDGNVNIGCSSGLKTPVEIVVYDVCGKIQYQGKNQNQLDLTNLSQGIYFLSVTAGEKSRNVKLIISK